MSYRFRWPLTLVTLAGVGLSLALGIARLGSFSDQVTALDEVPSAHPPPRLFDPRTDIWFDPEDSGIRGYYAIEDEFIGEDLVAVSFEETKDPHGVFGARALETIARMSDAISRAPHVRNVRSLTENPWIRWGQAGPDEEGLVIGDLFEEPVSTYTEAERIERMVAILGAKRAARLAGEGPVQAVLGKGANFDDSIGEPRLMGAVVSEDGRSAALLVQVLRPRAPPERVASAFADDEDAAAVGPTIRVMEQQREALEAIEAIVAAEDGYTFHVSGLPVVEREFLRVGQSDMRFVGVMFGVIALALWLIYRRGVAVFAPLLVVTGAIMAMMGIVFSAGDLINNLTAIAPVMITAIGVADAVHLVTSYMRLRPQHQARGALITEVIRQNALPVFLTSLTTAIGFFSLVTSELGPIRQLGYTAGLGTLVAYLLSMTLVPALLSLIPLRKPDAFDPVKAHRADQLRARASVLGHSFMSAIQRRRWPIIVAASVVAIIAGVGMARMKLSTDLRLMFPDDNEVIRDLNWTEAHIGGGSDLEIVFYGPEVGDQGAGAGAATDRSRIATSVSFLTQVDAFQRRVEEEAKNPESPLRVLTNFDSALAVLRKMHQVQNQNRADFYRVPTEEDVPESARKGGELYDPIMEETVVIPGQSASTLVAQYYVQYENGAKPSENLSSLVSANRRGFRIAARTRTADSEVLLAAFARLRKILHTEFPAIAGTDAEVEDGVASASVLFSGKQYLFNNMFQLFSDTLIVSLSLALTIITLLIGLVYRSARLAIVSLIPNVLPLFIPLGVMGILDMPLDGPAIIVVSVVLGVCVDDTIHFLTKYTKALQSGLSVSDALISAIANVGAAITWTSLILFLGFGVLSMSDFRPNMLVGVLGATMVALAWVADMVVMPALLSILSRETLTQPRASTPVPGLALAE